MSREYGFHDWCEVAALGDKTTSSEFELALDDIVAGHLEALRARLKANPKLATERSAYGHGSTLLHYLGANGVETHRQKTPTNAASIARLLIDSGADVRSEARMYGGGQTAYMLAATSAHPQNAGILDGLLEVLRVG